MDVREKQRKAIELKTKGLSYRAIGQELGISRQRAQQLVRPPKAIYDLVRKRAEYKCERCEIGTRSGHVHHVGDPEFDYNDLDNLAYLCASCHITVHCATRERKDTKVPKEELCAQCGFTWDDLIHNPKVVKVNTHEFVRAVVK